MACGPRFPLPYCPPGLEDELQHHLHSSCVVSLVSSGNLAEVTGGRIHLNRAATEEPGMIQGVQKIEPYLELRAFSNLRVLEEREVYVIHVFRSNIGEPQREGANVSSSWLYLRVYTID